MTKNEFKELFELYFDDIRKYIYYTCGDEDIASDVAQDTFVKVWEKRKTIDMTRVKGLLYTMATHSYKSIYRHEQVKLKYERNFTSVQEALSPYDEMRYKEISGLLDNAIAQMSEGSRAAFLLSRVDELTYNEIAEKLGISVKAVEKRISIALGLLRSTVTNYYMGSIKL